MAKYDILLISDGTTLPQTLGWVLEYQGFAVQTAATPETALEAMVKKNYDLVIAQVTMGNLDGLDVLKRAKRLNPEVKVMVVSANNDAIFPMEAYQVEVDDYILMPVSPTELCRRVSRCLESREVVDLQPVVAASAWGDGKSRPQTMLMMHDIRGSMVSTAASLKLLARGFYGDMSPSVSAKIQEIKERIDTVIQLSEEFVHKSLLDQRPPARKGDSLDLQRDVVEPVLAELATEIQEQKISLVNRLHNRLKGRIPVQGSKLWLKSVFRNLINNGIKYGGRGCTIMVDFETQGNHCRLNVYNTGNIIPEEQRSMIFSYVPEMRPSRKSRQGLGLGLALSRDVIQNYGGDIWYEAKTDGSNFVMSLPQQA